MWDFHDQFQAQVAVFDQHLQRMVERRRRTRGSDAALIFSEDPPDSRPTPALRQARARKLQLVVPDAANQSLDPWDSQRFLCRQPDRPTQDDGSVSSARQRRGEHFVQLAFMNRTFYLDLPRCTLDASEARRLIRQRSGFFFASQRRWWFMTHQEWQDLIRRWNPLQKEYLNSDTRSAAEDVAHIFYRLWNFPLDWPLYYHAFAFKGKTRSWAGQGPVRPLPQHPHRA